MARMARRLPLGYLIERVLYYRDARDYWEQRGGDRYFQEQESMESRAAKSAFLAGEMVKLNPSSILEVGCGYGKQLKSIGSSLQAKLFGIDFSKSQLGKAKEYLSDITAGLSCADAQMLPFRDKSVDVVFTSAVLLHHPPRKVEKMIREICRVAKQYVVHNEDTDVSYSRYGINTAQIYQRLGYRPSVVRSIPMASDPARTQFTIIPMNVVSADAIVERSL